MVNIIKRDNTTVHQFLTFLKLQLESGYAINDEYSQLYNDYRTYCERNNLNGLSHKEFSLNLNNLGFESYQKWNSFHKKNESCKKLTSESINNALTKLGGEMIIENIYMVLDSKRYQLSIKVIPIDTPTIRELEAESKEVNALKLMNEEEYEESENPSTEESLNNPESGPTEDGSNN